jgi:hypothetical protein
MNFAVGSQTRPRPGACDGCRQNPLLRLPAVADNAAMSKPFQFSMRRMLAAVALFCVAAGLFAAVPRTTQGLVSWAELVGGLIALGTAFGALFGRPLFASHFGRIATIAAALLLFTLAVYSRLYTGWNSENEFDMRLTHSEMGLPRWLILNRVNARGSTPPAGIRWEADDEKYRPGWGIRFLPFLIAALGSTVVAAVFYGIGLLFFGRSDAVSNRKLLVGYSIVILPAIAVGTVVPTNPTWIGVCLGLGLLPICVVIAAALIRSYLHAILLGLLAVTFLLWSQRMADLFRSHPLTRGLPDEQDLIVAGVFISGFVLLAVVTTVLSRRLFRRKPTSAVTA